MKTHGIIWAGLYVEDLEASISFYRDVLDLPLLNRGADWAHLDAGQGAIFELFAGGKASHEPKSPYRQPLVLALRVDDLAVAVEELEQKGVAFTGEEGEYEGTRWSYFLDLEGNRLELKEARSREIYSS